MKSNCIKFGFILSVLMLSKVSAQNLIPNPSFEEYITCPDGNFQLCSSWSSPTEFGSPDFYHSCSLTGASIPYQGLFGFQYPENGEGMVGIYIFKNEHMSQSVSNLREYIQCQINTALEANTCYLFSMYVNLSNISYYSSNNIGCFISSDPISLNGENNLLLDYSPQINSYAVLNDTLNWIKISGIYEAIGGEEYLTIGNFFPDSSTHYEIFNPNDDFMMKAAYFYVDNVSLTEVEAMPAYAGEDISITLGDSTFIGQEVYNLDCSWSVLGGAQIATGKSGLYVKPVQNTTYVVEQNLCGTITHDTVTVFVHALGVTPLGPPSKGESIVPNPNNGTFTVHAPGGISEALLYDMRGRAIPLTLEPGGKDSYLLSTAPAPGMYILVITNKESNEQEVHKVWVNP